MVTSALILLWFLFGVIAAKRYLVFSADNVPFIALVIAMGPVGLAELAFLHRDKKTKF